MANEILRTAVRLLDVLRTIGEARSATILQLHRLSGLPRPTLYRIVRALCASGYVHRGDDGNYRLTFKVRSLAESFTDEIWVRDIAAPILSTLGKKIVWPTELATFEENAMFLRETTRRDSPLTIDEGVAGLRLPMLDTALGQSYLAFCSKASRQVILENLARSGDLAAGQFSNWESRFATIRKNGYALRHRGLNDKTGSLAVPIRHRKRVLGSIAVTYIAKALTPEQAVAGLLGEINRAARQIEAALRKHEVKSRRVNRPSRRQTPLTPPDLEASRRIGAFLSDRRT